MAISSQVHAPYHFVPLSKWVYMPDWAHMVSHDVPFKDGYSGVIEYKLTNASPLLVGGEQDNKDGQPTLVKWTRDPHGNPVIPGSSLKGMIRNVLEIAAFGKFAAVDENHFSFRDISNSDSRYAQKVLDSNSQAYWLKYDSASTQWTLRKTKHTVLFHDEFNRHSGCGIQNIAFKQPAEEKYRQWPLSKAPIVFDLAERSIEGTKGKTVKVQRAADLGQGRLSGYPVFSGFRPGKKQYTQTRLNFSYMFYDAESNAYPFDRGDELANKLFENHDEKLVSYLKKNPHQELGIPVFAKEDKNGKILALGFAKMPRMLYEKSVREVASSTQKAAYSDCFFDMSELLFGTLREKGFSLKSRVLFSDATCTANKGIKKSSPVILGQPKASYLPAYLEQPSADENAVLHVTKSSGLSLYENNSQLSGWKRYPVQQEFNSHLPNTVKDKLNVQSQLELMQPNSTFEGKIVFHNLKQEELGALLWAVKLGNEQSDCFHSLGHGKSLGAGAVQFDIKNLTPTANRNEEPLISANDFISRFTDHMNTVYPAQDEGTWEDCPQIRHLLAFADKKDNDGKNLTYMPLQSEKFSPEVSYTSSVQGREKQVLPLWSDNGNKLKRKEQLSSNIDTNNSFGRGRLASLINHQEKNGELTKFEATELEKKREKEKAAAFASLSPQEQAFIHLKNKLAPFQSNHEEKDTPQQKEGRQSCNADIEKLLDNCLSEHVAGGFLQELHDLSRNKMQSAFLDLANNKKNKPKLQSRKAKLADLVTKYNLKGGQ